MCLQHQNALWQRNAQRVHHNHAALGITLQKLLPGGVDIRAVLVEIVGDYCNAVGHAQLTEYRRGILEIRAG